MGFTEENIIIILNKMPPRPQTVTNMAAHPDFMCCKTHPYGENTRASSKRELC